MTKEILSKNNNGFTLLELLLVLAVMVLFLSFSVVGLKSIWDSVERHLFFTQLKSDLFYAQSYAMSHQQAVNVKILPFSDTYWIKPLGQEIIIERQIPSSVTVGNSSLHSIYFRADGNITKFGTMTFHTPRGTTKIIFYIGRGRFRVQE